MADEQDGTTNGVGSLDIESNVIDMTAMRPMRMPQTQEEALAMVAEQLGNNPDRIRQEGQEAMQRMFALAESIEAKQGKPRTATVTTETIVAVKDGGAASEPSSATFSGNTVNGVPVVAVPEPAAQASAQPAQAPAQTPPIASPVATEPKPAAVVHPPGYQMLGDGLYTWSPDIWGGLPLHFVPDRTIEAQDRPILIVGILATPAYGRNRMGRIVKLPEGARVVIHAGIAWLPILPLVRGTEGRPILYAVPTTIDRSGPLPIVKMATNKDDKIVRYETGDGGHEYGLAILYDPDPADPKAPRMVSLETLRGAIQK